ncbi:hypothetical protein [Paenibacillus sp.]|uniref:hypothetical protein n=1 Tax=Paenibacillus sp. TaxID=58172 RepID=UPI002D589DA4|nr:hypothetical protein [Paenibacillus sp.]HZG87684.1 hypothetical protein [Paenibacillus sp.]
MSIEAAMLKRDVVYAMYGKVKDMAVQQSAQLLADFADAQPKTPQAAPAPHPFLGGALDVKA